MGHENCLGLDRLRITEEIGNPVLIHAKINTSCLSYFEELAH